MAPSSNKEENEASEGTREDWENDNYLSSECDSESRSSSSWDYRVSVVCGQQRQPVTTEERLKWRRWDSSDQALNALEKDAARENSATGDMSATHLMPQGMFKTIPGNFVSKGISRRVMTPCHLKLSCPELWEYNHLQIQTRALQYWYFTSQNHFDASHCRFLGFFFFDHFNIK